MNNKILIVEDEFILANGLRLMLENCGFYVCGIADSVEQARTIIQKEEPWLVLLDIFLQGRLTGVDLAKELSATDTAFIYLSANNSQSVLEEAKRTSPYGFLVKPYREKDLIVAIEIAKYRYEQTLEAKANRLNNLRQHLAVINTLGGNQDELLQHLAAALQQDFHFDFLAISALPSDTFQEGAICLVRINFNQYRQLDMHELGKMLEVDSVAASDIFFVTPGKDIPAILNDEAFNRLTQTNAFWKNMLRTLKMGSLIHYPVTAGQQKLLLILGSRLTTGYSNEHIRLMKAIHPALKQSIQKIIYSRKQEDVAQAPQTVIDIAHRSHAAFKNIIGSSTALLQVLDHVSRIAPMDTTVLILGESGTGKEGIARAIHELSGRSGKPFVAINCAALPANLIESELFGHEKGAFTGANEKRIGKFEQAHGGTIFLDEIGELSTDLQVKLLRTLQEWEIERIGGKGTIKINVRLLAATNRNLEKEVAEGRFRMDLYYRLNVFPIILPPLRERIEDMPLLVDHFLNLYQARSNRRLQVSQTALTQLERYDWPGNIRELSHVIERSAILAANSLIENVLFSYPLRQEVAPPSTAINTIEETERAHIVAVLKRCNGRIYGPGGAAELLKIPPTTLSSKIKRLGIDRYSL